MARAFRVLLSLKLIVNKNKVQKALENNTVELLAVALFLNPKEIPKYLFRLTANRSYKSSFPPTHH
jgi:hypothetical protein